MAALSAYAFGNESHELSMMQIFYLVSLSVALDYRFADCVNWSMIDDASLDSYWQVFIFECTLYSELRFQLVDFRFRLFILILRSTDPVD